MLAGIHRIILASPKWLWERMSGLYAHINLTFSKKGDAIAIEQPFGYLHRIGIIFKHNQWDYSRCTHPAWAILKSVAFTFCYQGHLQVISEEKHHQFLRNILVSDFFNLLVEEELTKENLWIMCFAFFLAPVKPFSTGSWTGDCPLNSGPF